MMTTTLLHFPAIAFKQKTGRTLYAFTAPGSQLSEFLTIARIKRADNTAITGYQRPEVLKHIGEIKDYLETDAAMLPNALVVAFDDTVRFEPIDEIPEKHGAGCHGYLVVPVQTNGEEYSKPGWVVDGQQRMAALRDASLRNFNVCLVGFIARTEDEQREQFILVNSTKPLPKGLIYELLPTTTCRLPGFLAQRKFSTRLLARLNYDGDSPFRHRIKTPTNPDGVIKDNSVLRMIEHSLSDGVLYRFRSRTGEHDEESMLDVLKTYWRSVAEVFPDAWPLPPRRSRLTHGAGIVSMGFLMDAIADRVRRDGLPTAQHFMENLIPIRPVCRWTNGYWEFGPGQQRRWDEIQNTSKDIQLLTNYLMIQYKTQVWNRSLARS
ncbi:MAG: hypothetical protein KatS3mg015_2436 [Fimbriimonadales bacterium]|nr:MAG: hypothetical protein KatS3mg015_2436 [Fimbriimonadales bacterium]